MIRFIAACVVILGFVAEARAEGKPAKPKSCQVFSEATLTNGAKVGVCAPTKEVGKPSYLRSYQIVSVVNPTTGKSERLMIGFI